MESYFNFMRIDIFFVLFLVLAPVNPATILHFVEDDSSILSLLSLLENRLPHEDLEFHKYGTKVEEEREGILGKSNRNQVKLTFFFKASEPGLPIIISGPSQDSRRIDDEKYHFSKKIMSQLLEYLGKEKAVHLGFIPYIEVSHLSSPFLILRIPTDTDLEKFSWEFTGFLAQTFPNLVEDLPSETSIAQADKKQSPEPVPSQDTNWFFDEGASPFYSREKTSQPPDQLLDQFRKKAVPQTSDPFEDAPSTGLWGLKNPLQSLFSSRGTPPRSTVLPKDPEPPVSPPSSTADEKAPEDLFSAYFSQDSLHINPPREPSNNETQQAMVTPEQIQEPILSTDASSQLTSTSPSPQITAPSLSASLLKELDSSPLSPVNTFPESLTISQSPISLSTSPRVIATSSSNTVPALSSTTMVLTTASIPNSSNPTSSEPKNVPTLDLESLYFMQAPWDREPSETEESPSTSIDPIPEYLKP